MNKRANVGGVVKTDEKFDRFALKLFGPEPSPELLPLKAHEWRIKVAAASKVWTTLGLMWHEGKLPFEPREMAADARGNAAGDATCAAVVLPVRDVVAGEVMLMRERWSWRRRKWERR